MPAFKAFADLKRERQYSHEALTANAGGERSNAKACIRDGRAKLFSWYMGRESAKLAQELYGDEIGQHATPDEVRHATTSIVARCASHGEVD